MLTDSFVLAHLLVGWLISSGVLGIVAGGRTRLILGCHWGRNAAIGDALLACVVTYIAMQMKVSLTSFLFGIGPEFGAPFGPEKSIRAGENFFASDSASVRISPVSLVG